MRKLLFFSIILCFIVAIHAQENEDISSFDKYNIDYSQILIQRNGLINISTFETAYGNKLTNAELRNKLKIIPENEFLLYGENLWFTLEYSCLTLSGLSLSAIMLCSFVDTGKYEETIMVSSLITMIFALPYSVLCRNIAVSKRQRAVDNYNLYILGLPIR